MNKSAPDEAKLGTSLEQSRVNGKRQTTIYPVFIPAAPYTLQGDAFYLKKMAEECFELVQQPLFTVLKWGNEGGTLLPVCFTSRPPDCSS